MEVIAKKNERQMQLLLRGELDHHASHEAMEQMNYELDAALPQSLTMDFSGVTFMDSSGIALVLRADRRMRLLGGTLTLTGLSPQAAKVLLAAGIDRIITIR